MIDTTDIERSILVSVLEQQFIGTDPKIIDAELDPKFFRDPFCRKLVKGINRLKELDEPINTDFLRLKFMEAKAWEIKDDLELIQIITHNPIGTLRLFSAYYSKLCNSNMNMRYTI
jgi:hypothetical protein